MCHRLFQPEKKWKTKTNNHHLVIQGETHTQEGVNPVLSMTDEIHLTILSNFNAF